MRGEKDGGVGGAGKAILESCRASWISQTALFDGVLCPSPVPMTVVVVVKELSVTFTLIMLDIGGNVFNHQSLSTRQSEEMVQHKQNSALVLGPGRY